MKTELEEKYYALLTRMATAPLRDLALMEAESELIWIEILKERKRNERPQG